MKKSLFRDHLIPDDWNEIKLRQIFEFGKGLSITKDDLVEDGVPVISYGQIHAKINTGTGLSDDLYRYVPDSYLRTGKKSIVKRNDFIFADTSEDYAGIGNCAFVDRDDTIFAGYHSIIARPVRKEIFPKYYAYLFLSDFWRDQIRANVMGIKVFSVTQKLLRDTFALVPPADEQKRIADFLDKECAKYDSIIRDLENQVDLLTRYESSLITGIVKSGINKDVPLSSTNINWIGDIPAHWRVKKLRYLGSLQNGISKDAGSFGSGYPFISYGDVYNNIALPESGSGLVESTNNERNTFSVQYGDVFFTRTSETIEEIGIASTCLKTITDATFAGFLIRFRPTTSDLCPIYSKYYFRAEMLRRYFVKEMMIVTRASLGQNLLKNLPVLLPPIEEQEEIGRYLDKRCSVIESIISAKKKQITVMRSCRDALIYEYVTGKKRVKEGM